MDVLRLIAGDALVPGAFAAVLALVAAVLARRGRPAASAAAMALAVAGAFALGLAGLTRWPDLPLAAGQDAWTWLAWIGVATGALAAAGHLLLRPRGLRAVALLLVAAGAGWLLVEPFVPHALAVGAARFEVSLMVAFVGLVALLATAREAGDRGLDAPALLLLLAISGLAALLALYAGSAVLGRVTGALATGLGTAVGVRLVFGGAAPSRAATLPTTVLLGGMGLSAWRALNYEGHVSLPLPALAALAGGLILGLLALAIGRPKGRRAVILGLVLTAVGVAAALWITKANAPPPNPYG